MQIEQETWKWQNYKYNTTTVLFFGTGLSIPSWKIKESKILKNF